MISMPKIQSIRQLRRVGEGVAAIANALVEPVEPVRQEA